MSATTPAAGDALAHPRAFAIYSAVAKNGTLTPEVFDGTVKHYGCPACAAKGFPGSFSGFAQAVAKPATFSPPGEGDTLALVAQDKSGELSPFRFQSRALRPNDVRLEVLYCGMCHSDLHQVRDEWGGSSYPMVPGHEIVGVVTEVGPKATRFKVGDRAAIGCMVDSCGICPECLRGQEQLCESSPIWTYNSVDPKDGTSTRGGYSTQVISSERFVLRYPDSLPMDAGAPLLCAGITTYSPLRHHGLDKPGKRVGVLGLGGLGHIAVRLAKAFGAEVTVISTSESKRHEAVTRLGADKFVASSDAEAMAAAARSLDGILNTAPIAFDITPYLELLVSDGVFVYLGIPSNLPPPLNVGPLIMRRISVTGSPIGGIKETQEMLDFCAERGVVCDVEVVDAKDANTAMARLAKNDVRYRFVIDVAATLVSGSGGQAAAI